MSRISKEILNQPGDESGEEKEELIAQVITGESVYSHLKVRHGGKQPMFEMECRVMVSLNRISEVPGLVADTMDKIYTQAQKKNLLF
jgi:hypothetical protein